MKVAVLANLKKNAPHLPGDADRRLGRPGLRAARSRRWCSAMQAGGHEAWFLRRRRRPLRPAARAAARHLLQHLRGPLRRLARGAGAGHAGNAAPALHRLARPGAGPGARQAHDQARADVAPSCPRPPSRPSRRADEPLDDDMVFPLFVKPVARGHRHGRQRPVHRARPSAELREQLDYIIGRYKQTALVERYIEGREVTVGLVGNTRASARRPRRASTTRRRDTLMLAWRVKARRHDLPAAAGGGPGALPGQRRGLLATASR